MTRLFVFLLLGLPATMLVELTSGERELIQQLRPGAPEPILLWPDKPPQFLENAAPEVIKDNQAIQSVSAPAITPSMPPNENRTGMAIVVCAGGCCCGHAWKTHIVLAAQILNPTRVAEGARRAAGDVEVTQDFAPLSWRQPFVIQPPLAAWDGLHEFDAWATRTAIASQCGASCCILLRLHPRISQHGMPKLASFPKAFMAALCEAGAMTASEWKKPASTLDVQGLECDLEQHPFIVRNPPKDSSTIPPK